MNLKRFTKDQLQMMNEDFTYFLYNKEYCEPAIEMLHTEIEKELSERAHIVEIEIFRPALFGLIAFITFEICIILYNFIINGYMFLSS